MHDWINLINLVTEILNHIFFVIDLLGSIEFGQSRMIKLKGKIK